jgi:hypothetical protein
VHSETGTEVDRQRAVRARQVDAIQFGGATLDGGLEPPEYPGVYRTEMVIIVVLN